MQKRGQWLSLLAIILLCSGCSVMATILRRNITALTQKPDPVAHKITQPIRTDARLAVLWVGHATTLVQIDDKVILTDPVFTETVGLLSRRLVEPGIEANHVPPVDAVLVSHMHFDHLSLGSLDLLEDKIARLWVPRGGLVYIPNYDFPTDELAPWQSTDVDQMRITAVPVDHVGFRYGADHAWMTTSFTGWVIQYHGITVYFGGDTAYDQALFKETAARFPQIDLAILPIAPVEPPEFARPTHVDGREAVQAFLDLKAKHMLPIHYDTFAHGIDPRGYALKVMRNAMKEKGLSEKQVHVLPISGQLALMQR